MFRSYLDHPQGVLHQTSTHKTKMYYWILVTYISRLMHSVIQNVDVKIYIV
jgi:hypothetical protein